VNAARLDSEGGHDEEIKVYGAADSVCTPASGRQDEFRGGLECDGVVAEHGALGLTLR
jgi:hypothetical protein